MRRKRTVTRKPEIRTAIVEDLGEALATIEGAIADLPKADRKAIAKESTRREKWIAKKLGAESIRAYVMSPDFDLDTLMDVERRYYRKHPEMDTPEPAADVERPSRPDVAAPEPERPDTAEKPPARPQRRRRRSRVVAEPWRYDADDWD